MGYVVLVKLFSYEIVEIVQAVIFFTGFGGYFQVKIVALGQCLQRANWPSVHCKLCRHRRLVQPI